MSRSREMASVPIKDCLNRRVHPNRLCPVLWLAQYQKTLLGMICEGSARLRFQQDTKPWQLIHDEEPQLYPEGCRFES